MNSTDRWNGMLKGTGWPFGVLEALLLMAAVLIVIPIHLFPPDSAAYVILGLYLANWLLGLALVSLVLTGTWWLFRAATLCRQSHP